MAKVIVDRYVGFCDVCKSHDVSVISFEMSGYGDKFAHCDLCKLEVGKLGVDPLVKEMRRLTHIILKAIKETIHEIRN